MVNFINIINNIKKYKIRITLTVVLLFSGLFCLVKFNIINIEDFTFIKFSRTDKPKLVMDKIRFGERYAYEFDNYLGSANEPRNMSRIIEQNAILRKRYNPNEAVRLTPAIINDNEGIPLKQARIQLIFGQGIVAKNHRGWDEQEVNGRYSYKFNEPINNTALNTDYSIFIQFPKPGRYQIVALIDGEYLEGMKEVIYFIELYE